MKKGWHLYGNIDPFKIPDIADKVLNEYWDIADTLKIKTFLFEGTCLGFVRDGGYIFADNDIDVGILGGKIEEITVELVKAGFEHKRDWCENNRHFVKYDILLDVYYIFYPWERELLQPFDSVTYKDRVYNVPHPVEEYLKQNYGDWKTIKHRKLWEG